MNMVHPDILKNTFEDVKTKTAMGSTMIVFVIILLI